MQDDIFKYQEEPIDEDMPLMTKNEAFMKALERKKISYIVMEMA